MDCGWRLQPLLSAIDFRDKSKREEQFSCPQSEQIALSVDASAADLHIWSFSIVMAQSFFLCCVFDRWEAEGIRCVLAGKPWYEVSRCDSTALFVTLFYYSYFGSFDLADWTFCTCQYWVIRALRIDRVGQQSSEAATGVLLSNWQHLHDIVSFVKAKRSLPAVRSKLIALPL